jgi:alpha-ketoglutarate-dependent taurine dioxygenase
MNTEATAATLPRHANSLASLEIVPSGKAVGVEIRGVDLSLPIPDDVKRAIRQAWLDHLVVLFRGQTLTPEQYMEAAHIFGTPQIGGARKYYEKAGFKSRVYTLAQPEISILSNLDENGNPTERNSGLGSMEVVWHSDNSYIEKPPAGSCLYSLEVPAKSGNTSFNNQYLAYETLPPDLKRAIKGRTSIQDATRNSAGVLRPGVTLPERPADVPGPHHPLVRVHPETGKPALYLGRRRAYPSQYIVGLPEEESEKLLDRLWAHATQDKFKWTHTWKVGDLLVWDNRCAMHYRDPVDPTQRRVMWRSQFQGEEVVPA